MKELRFSAGSGRDLQSRAGVYGLQAVVLSGSNFLRHAVGRPTLSLSRLYTYSYVRDCSKTPMIRSSAPLTWVIEARDFSTPVAGAAGRP
jgi:hypothetical protein